MTSNLNPLSIIMAFFGVVFFIILTLLPSIIELKKPRDPGPKIIRDHDLAHLNDLDIKKAYGEDEHESDTSILKDVMAILALLPDLESQHVS